MCGCRVGYEDGTVPLTESRRGWWRRRGTCERMCLEARIKTFCALLTHRAHCSSLRTGVFGITLCMQKAIAPIGVLVCLYWYAVCSVFWNNDPMMRKKLLSTPGTPQNNSGTEKNWNKRHFFGNLEHFSVPEFFFLRYDMAHMNTQHTERRKGFFEFIFNPICTGATYVALLEPQMPNVC